MALFLLTGFELDNISRRLVHFSVLDRQTTVCDPLQLISLLQKINTPHARVAKFGIRTGLRIQLPLRDWGFKSPLSHQLKSLGKEFDEGRRSRH